MCRPVVSPQEEEEVPLNRNSTFGNEQKSLPSEKPRYPVEDTLSPVLRPDEVRTRSGRISRPQSSDWYMATPRSRPVENPDLENSDRHPDAEDELETSEDELALASFGPRSYVEAMASPEGDRWKEAPVAKRVGI